MKRGLNMSKWLDGELNAIGLEDIVFDFKQPIAATWSIGRRKVIGDLFRDGNLLCLRFKVDNFNPDILHTVKVKGKTAMGIKVMLLKYRGYREDTQNKKIDAYYETAIFGRDYLDVKNGIKNMEVFFQKTNILYDFYPPINIDWQDNHVKIESKLPQESFCYGKDLLEIRHPFTWKSEGDETRVYHLHKFNFSMKTPVPIDHIEEYLENFGLAFSFCIKDIPRVSQLRIISGDRWYPIMTDIPILSKKLEAESRDPTITLKKHPEFVHKLFLNWPSFIDIYSHCVKKYIPIRVAYDTEIEEKIISLVKILECLVKSSNIEYLLPGELKKDIDKIIRDLEKNINTATWNKNKREKVQKVLLDHGMSGDPDKAVDDIFSKLGISNINGIIAKLIMHFRFIYDGDSEKLLPTLIATCVNLRNIEAHGGKREHFDFYMLLATRNLLLVLIDSIILEYNGFTIEEVKEVV